MFSSQGSQISSGGSANYIEDVFSTYLYTGNRTVRNIENGINLSASNSGGSVLFDGTGDYLSVPTNAAFNLGTNDFTVECWVYRNTSTAGYETMLGFDVTGGLLFEIYQNQLDFGIRGTINVLGSGVTVPSNQWVHLAITRQSGVVRYFQNGTLTYTYTGTYATYNFSNNTPALVSGYEPGGGQLNGYISNLRLIKGTALYTSTFTPSTTPLTAVANTSLLVCQGPAPLLDKSTNAFPVTVFGDSSAKNFGPFTSATAGKGGLVWTKGRSSARYHNLEDTVRGPGYSLWSNDGGVGYNYTDAITSFNADGYTLGGDNTGDQVNALLDYVSWTFAKQPKFFDIVTATNTGGTNARISHNLGSVPGFVIVKSTDYSGESWRCYHRSLGRNNSMQLNLTSATFTYSNYWGTSDPTATDFGINWTLFSGTNYIFYFFAHDAGGFGLTGTDNVISCGTYTGTGASGNNVTLGYEPQWVMVKNTSLATEPWVMLDNMRGVTGGNDPRLQANSSASEAFGTILSFNSTGFTPLTTDDKINGNGLPYIYIAIRRGPMKVPTSGTSVFDAKIWSGNTTTDVATRNIAGIGSPTDLFIGSERDPGFNQNYFYDRLRGTNSVGGLLLVSSTTASEATNSSGYGQYSFAQQDGITLGNYTLNYTGRTYVGWQFKRAPSFFDIICYTGAGNGTVVSHNLGVEPELFIVKKRSGAADWVARAPGTEADRYLLPNKTNAQASASGWYSATSSQITFATAYATTAGNGDTYVGYLFATCAGVSKVGSYTGTGSTQTINCGFTGGARFVLIKASSTTGDWYVWDTARGMVAGNDPYLWLNSPYSSAEVTNTDWVDTASTGFELSNAGGNLANSNGVSYIFLAIA
jgi:hypothetical protein